METNKLKEFKEYMKSEELVEYIKTKDSKILKEILKSDVFQKNLKEQIHLLDEFFEPIIFNLFKIILES